MPSHDHSDDSDQDGFEAGSTKLTQSEQQWLQEEVQAATQELFLATEILKLRPGKMARRLAKGLPVGWVACRGEEGEVYYHNSVTATSQWAHPASAETEMKEASLKVVSRALKDRPKQKVPKEHSIYDARSRHVELPTPKSLLAKDSLQSVRREDLHPRIFALHGLLSEAEAASYVAAAEDHGFHCSDVAREFPSEVRNNSRLIHFSDALAAALWQRLAPHLAHRDIYLIEPMGYGAEGRWKPVGVNPCFRIGQYKEGEHFAAHRDGMFINENHESSIYSIVLYLNDTFTGGELELPEDTVFNPQAGSAVFFPHDTLHSARPPTKGVKYVARSELMFKCVDAKPAPKIANFVCDPLFQRMAALYNQIGDLAPLGDAARTTATYQEALSIQIGHKGTRLASDSDAKLPVPSLVLARVLSFLAPQEILETALVSSAWQGATTAGLAWRGHCQQRWPGSKDVIQESVLGLDPELRDWFGLYKFLHLSSKLGVRACTVFLSSKLEAGVVDGSKLVPLQPIAAVARHCQSGHPWDSSMKQRRGWRCGHMPYMGKNNFWLDGGEVNWDMLAALCSHAFEGLDIDASRRCLLLPTLPGVFSRTDRTRLARILTGRFRVPKVYICPAPLCALLARNLTTGIVIWGSSLGRSVVISYVDAEEVAAAGPFDFESSKPEDVAQLVRTVASKIPGLVLGHVVVSVHRDLPQPPNPYLRRKEAAVEEKAPAPPSWSFVAALQELLPSAELHGAQEGDVLEGAAALANKPEHLAAFHVKPEETPGDADCWEWRVLADRKWHKLPPYVAGVLESALRRGQENVSLSVGYFEDLKADLKDFTIFHTETHGRRMFRAMDGNEKVSANEGACKLTRFLRGCPSSTPDRRMPEELQSEVLKFEDEVEEVSVTEALHVRTLAGRLVLSTAKDEVNRIGAFVQELLQELSVRCCVTPKQLTLLHGAETLEPTDALHPILDQTGAVELMLVVRKEEPEETMDLPEEFFPEDWPAEEADLLYLQNKIFGRVRR
eukprot:TRINITY_DN10776_c1_g1_i1.p1 TRINITY_DN10776_c1_g1~~TRINITY_DN10776_c1_g1_i1.p1  ORF type:complete len:1010 (-),score=192.13 TRINITY_DN10776_c1_g1_i1:50-3079(-)